MNCKNFNQSVNNNIYQAAFIIAKFVLIKIKQGLTVESKSLV